MKIRLFGATNCQDCLNVLILIKKTNIPFEYIDVDDMELEVQQFCDENNVDQIPHIQFISDKEYVIFEHIGTVDADTFARYIIDFMIEY